MISRSDGRKDDAGKLRASLFPWDAWNELLSVLEHGAKTYGEHSWRRLENGRVRYMDAAHRHWRSAAWGPTRDADSRLLHSAHACINMAFVTALDLVEEIKNK